MRRLTTVARLKVAWGRKGALVIIPEAEVDLTKLKGRKVFIAPPLKEVSFLKVNEVLARGKRLVVFFEGINSIDAAESLKGRYIQVESYILEENPEKKEEDLAGFTCLTEDGKEIGYIREVLNYPAHKIIVVETGKNAIWIPFVDEFVKKVSFSDKKVIIFAETFEKNWGQNA